MAADLDSIDLVGAGSTDREVVDCTDLGAEHSILAGSSAALAGTAGLVGVLAASSVDTDPEAAPAVEDIHQLAGTANVPVVDHSPAAADSIVVDMALKEVSWPMFKSRFGLVLTLLSAGWTLIVRHISASDTSFTLKGERK